ncbi:VOC family protein [uncultured Tateyamaria sp.]|uniref:VOC family protein n=1 Tax=uncultured Tateyamaria sp. TaxID=455651 RepID=UPI0026202B34|nr:VOC family protein [uncultured Tateyamaria sp.]
MGQSSITDFDLAFNNIAIAVKDIKTAVKWYGDVLGFELVSETYFEPIEANIAFISRPGLSLELVNPKSVETVPELLVDPPAHVGFAGYKAIVFDVDDLAGFTQHLRSHEVTILWAEQALNDEGLKSTLFRDFDGNLINVFNRT